MTYEVKQTSRRTWTVTDGEKCQVMITEEAPGRFDLSRAMSLDVEYLKRLHAALGQALTDLAGERVDTHSDNEAPVDAPY